jgi:hypothetical protein
LMTREQKPHEHRLEYCRLATCRESSIPWLMPPLNAD